MPQRLSRIELDEISLVDLPATKRKFLFKKAADRDEEGSLICECGNKEALIDFLKSASEECPNCGESLLDSATKIIFKGDSKMKKLSELLIDFIGEDELEEEEIEKFEKADKKLSPEASKALKGALNILKKFKAEFPDEVKEAINTLAKYAAYGYPAKKKEDEEEDVDEKDLEKAGAKLSKATMELIKSVVEKGKPLEKAIKALSVLIQKDAGKSAEMIALEEKLDATLDKIDKLLKKKKKTKKEKKEEEEEEDEDEDKDEEEEEEDEEVEEAEKELKKLKKRIKKLEEKKGTKKSLKGQDDDEEEDEDEEKLDEDGKPIKKKKPWSFSLAKTETEE